TDLDVRRVARGAVVAVQIERVADAERDAALVVEELLTQRDRGEEVAGRPSLQDRLLREVVRVYLRRERLAQLHAEVAAERPQECGASLLAGDVGAVALVAVHAERRRTGHATGGGQRAGEARAGRLARCRVLAAGRGHAVLVDGPDAFSHSRRVAVVWRDTQRAVLAGDRSVEGDRLGVARPQIRVAGVDVQRVGHRDCGV